jgi:hypothetical protein
MSRLPTMLVSAGAADSGVVYLFRDTFSNDANGTSLLSHTPDEDASGLGWMVDGVNLDWEIFDGRARPASSSSAVCSRLFTVVANAQIEVTHVAGGSNYAGVGIRQSYRVIGRSDGGDNNVYLQQISGGGILATAAHVWAPGDELKITAVGQTIKVFLNDVEKISYASASLGTTNVVYALYRDGLGGSQAHRFDNLRARALAA